MRQIRQRPGKMMAMGRSRKLFEGAVAALATAAGAARHLSWYLRYHSGGSARDSEPQRRVRGARRR